VTVVSDTRNGAEFVFWGPNCSKLGKFVFSQLFFPSSVVSSSRVFFVGTELILFLRRGTTVFDEKSTFKSWILSFRSFKTEVSCYKKQYNKKKKNTDFIYYLHEVAIDYFYQISTLYAFYFYFLLLLLNAHGNYVKLLLEEKRRLVQIESVMGSVHLALFYQQEEMPLDHQYR
jgi:hypothetical protein